MDKELVRTIAKYGSIVLGILNILISIGIFVVIGSFTLLIMAFGTDNPNQTESEFMLSAIIIIIIAIIIIAIPIGFTILGWIFIFLKRYVRSIVTSIVFYTIFGAGSLGVYYLWSLL